MASKSLTAKSRRLLLGGGYSILVAGFILGVVVPFVRGTRAAHAEIARMQTEIETRQAKQTELDGVRQHRLLLVAETKDLDLLLPSNQDLGSFLTALADQFDKAGMKDISYHSLSPTPLGRSQKLPIELRGRGTYAQLHSFLTGLEERLSRKSSVGKLAIDADTTMDGTVEVQMTLYIYSTKPPVAQ